MASSGVFTIGCPFTLKLVLSTISRPVVLADRSKQTMEIRVIFSRNCLQACRTVHVSDGRQ